MKWVKQHAKCFEVIDIDTLSKLLVSTRIAGLLKNSSEEVKLALMTNERQTSSRPCSRLGPTNRATRCLCVCVVKPYFYNVKQIKQLVLGRRRAAARYASCRDRLLASPTRHDDEPNGGHRLATTTWYSYPFVSTEVLQCRCPQPFVVPPLALKL